jgi:predicted metalloprotease with PDZ domain
MRRAGVGAIYWGGAMFALLTDIEMRKRSDGARGIEDCLRAVRRDGGTGDKRWTTEEFIAACDRAVGGGVMAQHARIYYVDGGPVDLEKLWTALGVVPQDNRVTLRSDAPLAKIREAIIWGKPGGPRPDAIPFD